MHSIGRELNNEARIPVQELEGQRGEGLILKEGLSQDKTSLQMLGTVARVDMYMYLGYVEGGWSRM